MAGTLLFVHGTGVVDVSSSLARIRRGARDWLRLDDADVRAVEWGATVAPPALDIALALPSEITKSVVPGASDLEVDAARWDLLFTDPLLELRVLAQLAPVDDGVIAIDKDPPDAEAVRRVQNLSVDDDVLARAGVTSDSFQIAADTIANSEELPLAAVNLGTHNDEDLVDAIARAVVAQIVVDRLATLSAPAARGTQVLPPLSYDGPTRDALVASVAHAYAPEGTRGRVRDAVGGVLKPLAEKLVTRVTVGRRLQFMDPLTGFMRDVAWYVKRGEPVRQMIADAIRASTKKPVVVLAHSLGGIAAVDLLSDPSFMTGANPLEVGLLVTVGSQSPWLYLIDSLQFLRPSETAKPYVPWLNIYNRKDLLSFCAERVFSTSDNILDAEIDTPVPFPESHSAYWHVDRVYELISQHWPAR